MTLTKYREYEDNSHEALTPFINDDIYYSRSHRWPQSHWIRSLVQDPMRVHCHSVAVLQYCRVHNRVQVVGRCLQQKIVSESTERKLN